MREIKFRAIRKGSKEFLFGDLVHNCEGNAIFPSVLDENALLNSPDYYTIDSETIGQFTGLLDKNKTKIYEGDVVSVYQPGIGTTKRIVVFGASSFALTHIDLRPVHLDIFSQNELEVIGNVHQNPELLQS